MPRTLQRQDGLRLLIGSTANANLRVNGITDDLMQDAFRAIDGTAIGTSMRVTVDMQIVIGNSTVVKRVIIQPTKYTTFAYRLGRPYPSIITKAEEPEPTTLLTIIAEQIKSEDGMWTLRTAYCGLLAPPEPTDFPALAREDISVMTALNFWCGHAFVFRSQPFFDKDRPPVRTCWKILIQRSSRGIAASILQQVGYHVVAPILGIGSDGKES